MAGNGPAPKDPSQRRRRNASGASKTLLPAEGRKGSAPRWPLAATKPVLWTNLWRLPQAVMWERTGMVRVVARYALLLQQAEQPDASAALLGEVRQLEDRLGLNPKALRSLLWEVTSDEVADKRSVSVPQSKADAKRTELRIVG